MLRELRHVTQAADVAEHDDSAVQFAVLIVNWRSRVLDSILTPVCADEHTMGRQIDSAIFMLCSLQRIRCRPARRFVDNVEDFHGWSAERLATSPTEQDLGDGTQVAATTCSPTLATARIIQTSHTEGSRPSVFIPCIAGSLFRGAVQPPPVKLCWWCAQCDTAHRITVPAHFMVGNRHAYRSRGRFAIASALLSKQSRRCPWPAHVLIDRDDLQRATGVCLTATRAVVNRRDLDGAQMQAPQENHLLAALAPAVQARLFPALEFVAMPLGMALYESGDALRYVYFPTDSIVSLLGD